MRFGGCRLEGAYKSGLEAFCVGYLRTTCLALEPGRYSYLRAHESVILTHWCSCPLVVSGLAD